MPTTIVGQNGTQLVQKTRVSVLGCASSARRGVKIVKRRAGHHAVILTVRTFAAGRIRCSGKDLKTVSRSVGKASTVKIKIPFSRAGMAALRMDARHGRRRLKVGAHVLFVPSQKGLARSAASTAVAFR
jgi:hypothetical protein